MRLPRPAYHTTDGGGGGTPGAPPAAPAAPAAPVIPAPAAAPPAAPPVIPAPAAPPAGFTPAPAPWKEGEVWKLGEAEWWNAIPEEGVREGIKAKGYKTPAELAMAYTNLQKLQRTPDAFLALPDANATPEQKAEFDKNLRAKLGVPETPDKYELNVGDKADPNFVKFGKELAHDLGVPPDRAQKMVDKWNAFAAEQNAAALAAEQTQNETELTALETRWGAQFDEHLAKGGKALKALGLPQETVDRIESKIGSAAVVELMASLGAKIGEGTSWLPGGQPTNPNDPSSLTPDAARARINALNSDQAFMTQYMTKSDPGHAAALATMEALHKKANEKPAA